MSGVAFDINESVVLKDENVFLVSEPDGSLPGPGGHPFGLYLDDCRFLCGWQLRLMDRPLKPLAYTAERGHVAEHDLTNGELELPDGRTLEPHTLQIRLQRELRRAGALEERITIVSFEQARLQLIVTLTLCAQFEPMMWIRGMTHDFTPRRARDSADTRGLRSEVRGHDGVTRALLTAARPRPQRDRARRLRWQLTLTRGSSREIALRHVLADGNPPRRAPAPSLNGVPGTRRRGGGRRAGVRSDSQLFDRVLGRAREDLELLRSRLRGHPYFAGGIPWYATVFGRDTLITAIEMLAYDHRIARETLRLLGGRLARSVDDEHDAEPGKVLHELRVGELGNLGRLPFASYYGSVDGTPLLLHLLAEHASWTGDLELFESMSGEVEAALAWIDIYADLDDDGLIEYQRRSRAGLRNQGWKDSDDGVPDERGRPLRAPIALVEAQGYAMLAKRGIADLYERSGDAGRARRLRVEAQRLGEGIERFWLEREHFYAMALDRQKRPTRALASNQGHLLWCRAVSRARAHAIRDALMREEMFCGWGLRTLSERARAYNPLGYHTGSVWPHDSAMAAHGMRLYGFDRDFMRVFEGLLEAASRFREYRLPELFAGFSRVQYDTPVPYPVACHPQAWAAGSLPYLLTSALGLVADGFARELRVVRPLLPSWVNELELRGVRVADASVDLRFERSGDDITLADARVKGDLEVRLQTRGRGRNKPVAHAARR